MFEMIHSEVIVINRCGSYEVGIEIPRDGGQTIYIYILESNLLGTANN